MGLYELITYRLGTVLNRYVSMISPFLGSCLKIFMKLVSEKLKEIIFSIFFKSNKMKNSEIMIFIIRFDTVEGRINIIKKV